MARIADSKDFSARGERTRTLDPKKEVRKTNVKEGLVLRSGRLS